MNVLKRIGRKAIFLSLGVVSTGVLLLGPATPVASACYNAEPTCNGGYDYGNNDRYRDYNRYDDYRNGCPPWQEWRNDNPGDYRHIGGCVDIAQRGYVWCRHEGWAGLTWYLDPPGQGRYNGLDFGPGYWPDYPYSGSYGF